MKLVSKFSKFNELLLYACKGLCAVLRRLCLEPVCSASTVLFQFPDRFLVLVELVYLNIFRMAQAYRKYLIMFAILFLKSLLYDHNKLKIIISNWEVSLTKELWDLLPFSPEKSTLGFIGSVVYIFPTLLLFGLYHFLLLSLELIYCSFS